MVSGFYRVYHNAQGVGSRALISIKRADKEEDVRNIICDPELFGRISEDGHCIDGYNVDMSKIYLLIYFYDRLIGTWCIYPENKTTLNIHCNILKGFRDHGEEAVRLMFEWFVDESPTQYRKLNAEIPVIYESVYFFTKKVGFKDEGINRLSIRKNGRLVDQSRLGITRSEVKDELRKG